MLEFMLPNELLFKKLEIFACAFIEASVLYSNHETKFVISLVPDTRSITGRALHRLKFYLAYLLGIAT